MNSPSPLASVSLLLAQNGFSTAYVPQSLMDPVELLLVTATVLDGAVVPMRLMPLNGLAEPSEDLAPQASWLLHASAVFPFLVPPERVPDMLAATQMTNRSLPLCSLNISPDEGLCFLQACVPVEDVEQLPRRVLVDVIGMARYAAEMFAKPLKDLAGGVITLGQYSELLGKAGLSPQPIFNAR